MLNVAAETCLLIGALLLYLGMPHQKLLRSRPPGWLARGAGATLLTAAIFMLASNMSGSVSIFTAVVMAMTLWSLTPMLFAWLHHARRNSL